jgi:hypothetical protein
VESDRAQFQNSFPDFFSPAIITLLLYLIHVAPL